MPWDLRRFVKHRETPELDFGLPSRLVIPPFINFSLTLFLPLISSLSLPCFNFAGISPPAGRCLWLVAMGNPNAFQSGVQGTARLLLLLSHEPLLSISHCDMGWWLVEFSACSLRYHLRFQFCIRSTFHLPVSSLYRPLSS